jgi:transposase
MAPNLSRSTAEAIDECIRDYPNVNLHEVAATYRCSYEACRLIRKRIRDSRRLQKGRGRRSCIPDYIEKTIQELVDLDNEIYQDEIADLIYDMYNLKLGQSTISRLLKRLKITHKRMRYIALQREQILVDAWAHKMTSWDSKRLVFVDESACNEVTGNRKYGWAPLGVPARSKKWLKRSKRWSVLPAYALEGYIAPITFQGSITAKIFEWWLEHMVLPECNRWPGDRDILIMDNCSIHRSARVIDLCAQAGVEIQYLPPYCPFFNPIEESFAVLKAYIRRVYRIKGGGYEGFEEFLHHAIQTMGSGADAAKRARGHFRHAGYRVEEE